MTPQERMQTPEWQAWKRKYDADKRNSRRVGWFFAAMLALLLSVIVCGIYTGEIKFGKKKYGPDYEPEEITCTRSGWGGDC